MTAALFSPKTQRLAPKLIDDRVPRRQSPLPPLLASESRHQRAKSLTGSFQRVLEPHRRRPGFQRLRLALMWDPTAQPQDLERGAQAPIGIREPLGAHGPRAPE